MSGHKTVHCWRGVWRPRTCALSQLANKNVPRFLNLEEKIARLSFKPRIAGTLHQKKIVWLMVDFVTEQKVINLFNFHVDVR